MGQSWGWHHTGQEVPLFLRGTDMRRTLFKPPWWDSASQFLLVNNQNYLLPRWLCILGNTVAIVTMGVPQILFLCPKGLWVSLFQRVMPLSAFSHCGQAVKVWSCTASLPCPQGCWLDSRHTAPGSTPRTWLHSNTGAKGSAFSCPGSLIPNSHGMTPRDPSETHPVASFTGE